MTLQPATGDVLACPVRGCALPLRWEERAVQCSSGHCFDRARSGYVNLLQPQDKKSTRPGDSREAVQARRRTLDRGMGAALTQALDAILEGWSIPAGAAVLDVGCGEGTFLAHVAERFALSGWGLDLSPAAAEAAARAHPSQRWVVANADRTLPFLDQSLDLLLSITSRKNGPEFRRVLKRSGRLVVVVAGDDDLSELRAAVLGDAPSKDRAATARIALSAWFEPLCDDKVTSTHALQPEALEDLLRGSYRGERHSQRKKVATLEAMQVTLSWRVLGFTAKEEG
jgi:23S rRNA (guanine745-N1)-methyltransferase